jgi:Pentapeptide repeats (8 copies)
MNPVVESALISAVATLVGVGGTVAVAIVGFRISRSTNQATIDAARATADKTIEAAHDTNKAAIDAAHADVRRTLEIAREGQITERFTRAIDQLGHAHLDVRLGGIYALERIARDSPGDRVAIGEVLIAFIRSHAPWPPSLPGQYLETAPIDRVPKLQTRAPDVQASLWVLGRGGFADALGEDQWLDLSAVDLRRADLRNARLGHVDLRFAGLQRAFLAGALLRGAYLDDSHLEGARFSAADLEGANLDGTYLQGAEADVRTKWPEGFDWRAAGVTVSFSGVRTVRRRR